MNIAYQIAAIEKKLTPFFASVTAHQYAWWLLEKVTGQHKTFLLTNNVALSCEQSALLDDFIHQITRQQKPIAYVLGTVPFGNVIIQVTPPILIPRPETEEWVYNLIEQLQPYKNNNLSILDLCTGSGCIAIALAKAFPLFTIWAADISKAAINVAQHNITHNQIENVRLLTSNLFENIQETFDIIVSNPPYIPDQLINKLDPSVQNWEDPQALFATDNGLYFIKKIINQAALYLRTNQELAKMNIPNVYIETDSSNAQQALLYMQQKGYSNTAIHKDFMGNDRLVAGWIKATNN